MSGFGDVFRPKRRVTRVVRVGDVAIGGDHPIRVQSMTNSDTMDTLATVDQVTRLAEAGCEIVRITAPSIRDAENLKEIRGQLKERRIEVPLVADIHFTPNAAMIAADLVEKVRINPGNYADKKKFEVREYADSDYEEEIIRVADRFRPLVQRCKKNGVAMRIGTNHGSLSDRIMNRFGDTPEGMVESALEFLDVCEAEDYRDIVFSMKSSNTQVAIQAYRLLAARLEARAPGEPGYPFHVGVTEAGDSEDGRIKSAIGIGSLLEDGLGDTIRVSLTEDPVREVPVAREIARRADEVLRARGGADLPIDVHTLPFPDPFSHTRRSTATTRWGRLELGGDELVRVEIDLSVIQAEGSSRAEGSSSSGLDFPAETAARLSLDLAGLGDLECESLLVEGAGENALRQVDEFSAELASLGLDLPISLRVGLADDMLLGAAEPGSSVARWVGRISDEVSDDRLSRWAQAALACGASIEWELEGGDQALPALVRRALKAAPVCVMSLSPDAGVHTHRVLVSALADAGAGSTPIVLRHRVRTESTDLPVGIGGIRQWSDAALIDASVRLGALLCDGIGDVVSISPNGAAAPAIDLAYRVLQGARLRSTRTEYISCPSCGRTLFDLEETTARIKARTDHLKGVKIAVMGCIVNGPGEMADADFGYVGSGVGQVTLYVGKEIVARAVPEEEAPDRLVDLIRDHGQWVEAAGR